MCTGQIARSAWMLRRCSRWNRGRKSIIFQGCFRSPSRTTWRETCKTFKRNSPKTTSSFPELSSFQPSIANSLFSMIRRSSQCTSSNQKWAVRATVSSWQIAARIWIQWIITWCRNTFKNHFWSMDWNLIVGYMFWYCPSIPSKSIFLMKAWPVFPPRITKSRQKQTYQTCTCTWQITRLMPKTKTNSNLTRTWTKEIRVTKGLSRQS